MSTIRVGRIGRIILALTGLLLAALVLPGGSEPQAEAAPESQAGEAVEPRAWYTITVPAASFIPTKDNWDYDNNGYYVTSNSSSSTFVATVPFPFPAVTVKQVILYAYDNEASSNVCVTMYRAKPVAASEVAMAQVCSSGASTVDPRTFKNAGISAPAAGGYTSAYLWVSVPDGSSWAYGVTIKYTA
jgi:hypothetical protein